MYGGMQEATMELGRSRVPTESGTSAHQAPTTISRILLPRAIALPEKPAILGIKSEKKSQTKPKK